MREDGEEAQGGASWRSKLRGSLTTRTATALAGAVIAALVFLKIAEDVLEGEATAFDRSVSLWLHGLDAPALDVAMRVFTFMGSAPFVSGLVVLVTVWLLLRRARTFAGIIVAVASVTVGLNLLLKTLFHRPRPQLFYEIPRPESFSFPSGHAMTSAAVYGILAFVIARVHPRARAPLYVGASVLVLLVGISRVFLGVHWPTDVLAGFAAGGVILAGGTIALGSDAAAAAGANRR
jgi:undecaprenyl-diphosphatase